MSGKGNSGTKSRKRKSSSTTTSSGKNNNNNNNTNTSNNNNNKRMFSNSRRGSSNRGSSNRGGYFSSSSSSSHHQPVVNIDVAGIEKMFADIADETNDQIATMEGLAKLCEESLGLDPYEDPRVLVLVWKLGAKEKPGQISKEEWVSGCKSLVVDSVDKMKGIVSSLDLGFLDHKEFRVFYQFAFRFNFENPQKKNLDKDLALDLMNLLLKDRNIPEDHMKYFAEFLRQTKDRVYDRINMDQWISFYDFAIDAQYSDLPDDLEENYDESSGWPVLIDDYVEFVLEKLKKK